MGCWHETCGISGLPVTSGDKVRYMIIRQTPRSESDHAVFYPYDIYQPASILIEGEYDDYGGCYMSPTHEALFFESLKTANTRAYKTDMHGMARVNGEEYRLTKGHFHWFGREDAFQMLGTLMLRDDAKTMDAWETELAAKIDEIIEEQAGRAAFGFASAYEISRKLHPFEMPRGPIHTEMMNHLMDCLPNKKDTPIEAENRAAALITIRRTAMADHRLLIGMNTLRKMLHPTGGAGSQAWNDTAYSQLAAFIAKAATEHRAMWDSEED